MLTVTAARALLVLHTALGVAAVGAATHLVLWLRPYLRGAFERHASVRRFAWLALALHAAGFLVGNLMYPTYRVEVRAAYLEVHAAQAARWFDVKEHWIALGLFGSAALALILMLWDPRRDTRAAVPGVFGLACIVAGTLWLAAVIGVLTAASRAI